MKRISLIVMFLIGTCMVRAQHITGSWHGDLNAGSQKLGIVFHFEKDSAGKDVVKMDVPAQGAKDIPVKVDWLADDSVSLQVPVINVVYTGKWKEGTVEGTFVQHGMSFPLNLTTGEQDAPARPQEPKGSLGYKTEEVSFSNDAAGATLSGTLTCPAGYSEGKKVPVVLMVTGSGAQNWDEEVFGHKPFLVIADYLAKNGIASLRYDDRGVGRSTGNFKGATSRDFADDAAAGIAWLKNSRRFGKVGVLGHSEGGMIAFMLGADSVADFIVSMAGPGIKGDSLLAEQQNAQLRLYGKPANRTVKQVREEMKLQPKNAWLDYFADYDPTSDIMNTTVPVMAINGSHDMQVLAESNLGAIRKYLADGNRQNLIKEYPGLNHLFQHCQLATSLDYYRIEETCAPEVLKDIADWINALR